MLFDFSKLSGKIIEKYGTRQKFSEALGLSERSLSLKLNSKVPWKTTEVMKACTILDIPKQDAHEYFFNKKVQ